MKGSVFLLVIGLFSCWDLWSLGIPLKLENISSSQLLLLGINSFSFPLHFVVTGVVSRPVTWLMYVSKTKMSCLRKVNTWES